LFPSPCGEKVGVNDKSETKFWDDILEFPSPCGEKVGVNGDLGGLYPTVDSFRPLAGKR